MIVLRIAGSTWLPREQGSRFLVAGWWFLTVIVSATYTGNLIAALAVPRTVMPVQTLEDLARQTTYKYGPVDGTAIYSLIKASERRTDSVYLGQRFVFN